MNSDYANLTSAKFTAGKRYRIQCTVGGAFNRSTQFDAAAFILFRAPTEQRSADLRSSAILTPGGEALEFDYTTDQAIYGFGPNGDTSISIVSLS